MTRLTTAKLVVALLGIGLWLYGHAVENESLRWLGIAVLLVAVLLRFAGPRPRRDETAPGDRG